MPAKPYNILFLCTGNSARSILAEAILNHESPVDESGPRFRAYSAGSFPRGTVNPHALKILESAGLPIKGLRSKSWDEFAAPDAPQMDFVFTVCDNAAQEVCPVWPGRPVSAHWGMPDPAEVQGEDAKTRAFRDTFRMMTNRIRLFLELPMDKLDHFRIKRHLDEIGQSRT